MNYEPLLHFLKNRKRIEIPLNGYKPAASLVPLTFNETIHILITKRAAHLKHHPSQCSFPGGHIEDGESPLDAALREVEEEIGIEKREIKIFGRLDDVVSISNFHLTPFVGEIPFRETYNFDRKEVESVHLIPLKVFLKAPEVATYYWKDEPKESYVYSYNGLTIFGVTAFVIKGFVDILHESGFIAANSSLL